MVCYGPYCALQGKLYDLKIVFGPNPELKGSPVMSKHKLDYSSPYSSPDDENTAADDQETGENDNASSGLYRSSKDKEEEQK